MLTSYALNDNLLNQIGVLADKFVCSTPILLTNIQHFKAELSRVKNF